MRHSNYRLHLLLAAVVTASAASASEREVERYLFRPNPAVDPNARGRIELEIDNGGSEQKIHVRIERIDTVVHTYSLWLEDPLASAAE